MKHLILAAVVCAVAAACHDANLPVALGETEFASPPSGVPEASAPPSAAPAFAPDPPVAHAELPATGWTLELGAEPATEHRLSYVRSLAMTTYIEAAYEAAAEFLSPDGNVYQVVPLEPGTGARRAELPVAGTLADAAGLSGRWTVRLRVNGEVVAARSFEVSP